MKSITKASRINAVTQVIQQMVGLEIVGAVLNIRNRRLHAEEIKGVIGSRHILPTGSPQ